MKRHPLQLMVLVTVIALALLSVAMTPGSVGAQTSPITCAVTPDRVDGQGFDVSGFGFDVSGFGFDVSGFGFDVSGFGFDVSGFGFDVSGFGTIEEIVEEILTNQTTPAWLTDGLGDVNGGTGYNTVPVYLLIIDDFGQPGAHGFGVRKTADDLIAAVAASENGAFGVPQIIPINVDISSASYDAAQIAGVIKNAVDTLPPNAHIVANMSFGLVPCEDSNDVLLVDRDNPDDTFLVTTDFSFDGYLEGPPDPNPDPGRLRPILECVSYDYETHTSVAYYGYNNPNDYTVEVPIGRQNRFIPHPRDRGQPTVFAPGRQSYVFSVPFDRGRFGIWYLNRRIALPERNGRHWNWNTCDEIPEENLTVAPMGYSLSDHFSEQLGIPDQFIDEYFIYLFNSAQEVEDPTDPFANIQQLMRYYLQQSYNHATDTDPNSNFALIPVASSGNFRHLFGGVPFKPAVYPEVIATSASVGDFGPRWALSHDGNVIAPGVSYALETDAEGQVTKIGAGTSYAAPYFSVLASRWLSYPNACQFGPGLPPLVPAAVPKDSNHVFTGELSPLACSYNLPPSLTLDFATVTIDEGAEPSRVGEVSDPNEDPVFLSSDTPGVDVTINEDGSWSISADDGTEATFEIPVVVTANDGRGGTSSVVVTLTILNTAPTAEFVVSSNEITTEDAVDLSLQSPFDPSTADTNAGFNYSFDCDVEDQYVDYSGPLSTFQCSYEEEGVYTVVATIADKDEDYTEYFAEIEVFSLEPVTCYAQTVESYVPGTQRDGDPIPHKRRDPENALGAPQDDDTRNFASLGFGDQETTGVLILGFGDQIILDHDGDDFRVWETSYRDRGKPWSRYPEAVDVYASTDGYYWAYLGQTNTQDQAYDLSLGELPYAAYIKLVDVTDPSRFGRNADGFDVDAVEGFSCGDYYGEGEGED